ncbi:MAG TPA: DUF2147 domain-containing protein [Burkholderiaceae bacterium]|nr:DUF2147 domain-containing protein [Burkholderiaceae bacterium]
MRRLAAALLLVPIVALAQAASGSPVGLWRTIDDATGRPRALVRLFEEDGRIFGRIEQGLDPNQAGAEVCDLCTDERRGMPKIGLIIIRNMERDGDVWSGGDILDPDNGKVYRCRLRVVDDNRSLEVRGFIGFALLGRTQMWERVD